MAEFNGLGMSMGNLSRLSSAKSRSISPENFTGEKGKGGMATEGTGANAGRDLGQGWKISPSVRIQPGEIFEMADIKGQGAIQQMWLTPKGHWRFCIIRIYWDDSETPAVECPIGDFFACGWQRYAQVSSLAVCVNPGSAFNSYWEMPFRKRARMTVTNIAEDPMTLYYQVNYTLTDVPKNCAYFHAQFRRTNPLPYKDVYTIVDGIKGKGHYVGTYMAWQVNNTQWWGEGEIKFYMDGDGDFATIVGTGTEDYFCGSYNFDLGKERGGYHEFTTSYAGLSQVIRPDGLYDSQQRFGLYRWHIPDPIRFEEDLRVTIQALGWRTRTSEGRRYLPMQDDISSVAFWYQTLPSSPFPELPDKDYLEVI
ncbi:MAG: glycoside hydrolase family 172 protein [Candidatus Latescibacterota bacterium]|nr:glycoside hydrolase family 172 protein [Candidatus Latescibacterota bacterium]